VDHKAPGRTTLLLVTECGVTHQCSAAGSDFQRLRAKGPILIVPAFSLSAGKVTKQGGIFVSRARLMGGGLDQKGLATGCRVDGRLWSPESTFSPQHLCTARKYLSLVLQVTQSCYYSSVCASGHYPVNSPLHCNAEGFWAGGSARCAPIH